MGYRSWTLLHADSLSPVWHQSVSWKGLRWTCELLFSWRRQTSDVSLTDLCVQGERSATLHCAICTGDGRWLLARRSPSIGLGRRRHKTHPFKALPGIGDAQ